MLNTLIIDDEPLAHDVIKHHFQDQLDFKTVGNCYNATQALRYLANHQVDLLILDINMPALSGIELLKVLVNRPQVIIISAYQEYALEGYELDITDYLLKPVSLQRFLLALDKVQIHKSFIVNRQHINAADTEHVRLAGDKVIKVGKSFKDSLLGLL